MRELRWPLLVIALCLPIVLLATGVRLPWAAGPGAVPLAVPSGDREVAWLHTTTNAATWERFVSGVVRAKDRLPWLAVDDARAFLPSTTDVPEVVLSRGGQAGSVRIRWYKLQTEVGTADWVKALAARSPAPLAVIGGGSTDRAIALAEAMNAQQVWRGDRPPLLITTATADYTESGAAGGPRLVEVYRGHTFRFCFSNRQMAEAVVRFVADNPDARPLARPPMLAVEWTDDPYSIDLREQFRLAAGHERVERWRVPLSVGGLVSPNLYEAKTADAVAAHLGAMPDERVVLVLPTNTHPARRLLRAVVQADPEAAGKLTVVTGDSIPLNAVYRDGEFAWPVSALPVPLVFFAHANPVAWDDKGAAVTAGYRFDPPNGTEEAMHFRKLAEELAAACFPDSGPPVETGSALVARLQARTDFFDPNGERKPNTGEHVVLVTPGRRPGLTVWQPAGDGRWAAVTRQPVPVPYSPAREDTP